jgi:hypothetical protein
VKVLIKFWKLQTIYKVLDGFKLAAPQEWRVQELKRIIKNDEKRAQDTSQALWSKK